MSTGGYKASWPFWVLGVVVVLAGGSGFFAFLIPGVLGLSEGMIRVESPGETEISIDRTGTWTIFHESVTSTGGPMDGQGEGSFDIRCTVTRKSDGLEVAVRPCAANLTYSNMDRSGYGVLEFTVDEPGAYVLLCESGDAVTLAVAHEFMGNLMRTIFGSCAVSGVAVLLAAVLIVVAVVRTVHNSRLRKQTSAGEST